MLAISDCSSTLTTNIKVIQSKPDSTKNVAYKSNKSKY